MKTLGPKETEIIARLSYEKTTVITKVQLEKLFGQMVLVRQIIYQLKNKGILKPITKGVYYYCPLETGPQGIRINEFLIPPILFPTGNYYVGYSNMYNYYGFTEQLFQTMYILNTSIQRQREICGLNFRLLKIPASRMYGLETIKIGNNQVIVSDRERTLIDLFYYPDPVGGLVKAFEILKDQVTDKKIKVGQLIDYTQAFPVKAVQKRIGYCLDNILKDNKPLEKLAKQLADTSYITLSGSKCRQGTIDKKWKVIIDAS